MIINISDSDKHFSSAIEEYLKRLGKQISFETLKPFKDTNRELIIQKETEQIVKVIEKKYQHFKKFLLIKEGERLTTEELHQEISHKDCVFIIGGPYGLLEKDIKRQFPDSKQLSFWAITMPHGLAKLVLIEQLYRCSTLDIWKNYHY